MQRRTIYLALGITLLLLAFIAGTAVLVWRVASRTVEDVLLTPQEKVVDLSALVTQVRELSRLETAAMRVVHVGRVTQSYKMVPDAISGDEITFLATGDVIAGIDLSRLTVEDVWRSPDGTLHVRLPPPHILVSRVDNKESRVMSRKTGMLRRADINLESRARQHAEENIRAEALRKGILPLAAKNAEAKMGDLLHTFGFERVIFEQSRRTPPPMR
ncbi:MAG TPA: DUF4230 domain-containing protein [Thermoanaerobaculia bacterium]